MSVALDRVKQIMSTVESSLSYDGSEFLLWQKNAREKLKELLYLENFEKVSPEKEVESDSVTDGIRQISFSFNTEKYYRTSAKICIPQNIENPPIIIMLSPHSPGKSPAVTWWDTKPLYSAIVGDDTPENLCKRAAEEGFAAISLDVRDQCFEATMINHLMARTTQGERVWDIMRLIDILESDYSDVLDTEMIACMGEGNSGISVVYAGALEDRIKLIISSNAVSSFKELTENRSKHCACQFVPDIVKYFEMDDVIKMAFPKYYIQASSTGDARFDINDTKEVFDKVQSVYKNMGEENKCKYIYIDGSRKFHADKVWESVNEILK